MDLTAAATSASTTLGGVAILGAERTAAATGSCRIWIVNLKTAAHYLFNVIDGGTAHIIYRYFINDHFYAMALGDQIFITEIVVQRHPILIAGATTTLDINAQAIPLEFAFFK